MVRLSMLTRLLLCVVAPSNMAFAQSTKEVEVNGVHLRYVEQGSGEPIVFVHGGLGDQRSWEPVGEEIAKKYRFVAVTLRYYGASPWKDDGREFSVATHADDLEKVMSSLNAGPVHLVGYSYGGAVATTAALKNPSLVRSLTVYEPALVSVLPAEVRKEKQRAKTGPSLLVRLSPLPRLAILTRQPGFLSRECSNYRLAGSTACRKQRRRGCLRTLGLPR
jgi:pimeloyl-ACP methyl ester carboxylesterase